MATDQVQPYVEILEQPASKALRFRYESEGKSAGSIPGVNSTPENKTFPSIRIVGYKGPAIVIVSCVTKDAPYRSHPHNLVGKKVCEKGICKVEIRSENMVVPFSNLGIQRVRRQDIEKALTERQKLRVVPFQTGFEHPTNIDLNAVRLCFQVFLEGSQKGKFNKPLLPIVSDPIYDKKSDLVICELSGCSASVAGGIKIILLCEKIDKEDIEVRFFEEKDGQLVWEEKGEFLPIHVHKQTAITFRTPSYRTQQVENPVKVHIQLRKPSNGATSEPRPFEMLPLGTDDRRKRPKLIPNRIAVPTETEKHKSSLIHVTDSDAANQPCNTTNFGSPEQILFGEPGTSTGGFTLPLLRALPPPSSMQTFRSQVSPGQTSSPVNYNLSLIQQPYQPNIQPIIQQGVPVTTDMQQYNQLPLPNQPQLYQPDPNLPMLTRITPEDQGGLNNTDAANQPCNTTNFGSPEQILFGEPGTSTGSFTLPLLRALPPPSSMQTFRSQVSPGQTSSPVNYNLSLIQQPYQPNIQPIIQQGVPVTTDMQQYNQLPLPNQPQLYQPDPNLPMLTRITPEDQGGLNNTDATVTYNFEEILDEFFADAEANLSTDLTMLSISDSI